MVELLCRNQECIRVIAPGAEYCCGSCQLALLVDYQVPPVGNLAHTEMCERRQMVAGEPGVSS